MRRLTTLLGLVGLLGAAWTSAAEEKPARPIEWSFSGALNLAPSLIDGAPRLSDTLNTVFHYRYDFLHLLADVSLADDERYVPEEPFTLGHSFLLNDGGFLLDLDFLSFRAGRFVHRDFLDTPYSLFISSEPLPAVLADLTFHGGPFTYESRWVRLNTRSQFGWPDRGASYKVFALELGDWRFGVQDSAVYVSRVFDEEYFLSPVPHILTQMVTKRDATPWREQANDNSIMGLFAEWRPPRQYYYAQWLVDDISLDFLIPWFLRDTFGDRRIASKMAWSIGGRWELPFGRLGVYHAGATKYTFEATNDAYPYGYTYYPATEYDRDGTMVTLDYRDNYLGYRYGENNLAFMVELAWPLSGAAGGAGGSSNSQAKPSSPSAKGAELRASLEYVLSGSKSPANPWHEHASASEAGRYTQMLDEPVLEHTVAAAASVCWPWRGWTFFSRLRLGGVFNRLGRAAAGDEGPEVFRPQPGDHDLLYALTVGAGYTFHIGRAH